jgi:hypothetical protein
MEIITFLTDVTNMKLYQILEFIIEKFPCFVDEHETSNTRYNRIYIQCRKEDSYSISKLVNNLR